MNPITVEAFEIPSQPGLDSIRVIFQDAGPGRGRVIIECFGKAWGTYWGAMGNRTIKEFIKSCDADYLARNLCPALKLREEAYLKRIVTAIQAAL